MAYDEGLAERLGEYFAGRLDVVEKKMFGGIAFMVKGHMCCGIVKEAMMARVGPDQYAALLETPFVRPMDFTGKPMNGFVYVDSQGFESDKDLAAWVQRCESYVNSLPPK